MLTEVKKKNNFMIYESALLVRLIKIDFILLLGSYILRKKSFEV